MNCNNCNTRVNHNYCPNCGQPAKLKRIDGHFIQHEIEHVLHFDKGILYTIKELLIRPGQNIKEFISENRNKLVKPIIFIIVTSLVYTLIVNFFHIEDGYVKYENTKTTSATLIFKWIQEHYGYSNIIMGIFIALWTKIFFRKYKYNIFEILILLCFVMGIEMLIFALFAAIEGITKIQLMQISTIIALVYSSWAIGQFFDKAKVISYVKASFAYILGMIMFTFTTIAIGIIIDMIYKN
ncbi:MAG: DUF3667 domain-containing protein [Bacteroidetes bacterium]|nr:DUF3667 domain-containing protein [Bacteroidota bacterium]